MKRFSRFAAGIVTAALAISATPAHAQIASEFSIAKVIKQGSTSHPIAGSGVVEVQVQVNGDGTHKVQRIIKSTNSGDNDAATDIANTSTYRPAHKGTQAVTSFYTFRLVFSGKSVSQGGSSGSSSSSGGGSIESLIRAGKYDDAKRQAQSALLSSPGNDHVRQLLGLSLFYTGDNTGSAQAFSRVATIDKQFAPVAAQAFANAAITAASDNAAQALTYAQKARSLDPNSTLPKLSMGVADVANKNYTEGIAELKSVHDKLFADPKTDSKVKVGIDSRLLEAYIDNNDTADAQAISAEIKQIDPSSTLGGRVLGNHYLQAGVAARDAKNLPDALKNFDQAAAVGDPQVAVTANVSAAFALLGTDKPDYNKVKAYADKALALKADSPEANYAEGIAYAGLGNKDQARDFCTKADNYAKAQGNTALALQIETFVKNNIK